MTQVAFAQRLGLTRAKLCDIEKGRRSVRLGKAAQWTRRLGYGQNQFIRLALQDQVREEGLKCTVSVA